MSDLPADYVERLNLRELVARIDRQREEALKLNAERDKLGSEKDKLVAEALKLAAEQAKMSAEEAKLRRDRSLAPIVVAATIGGVIAGAVATILAQLAPMMRGAGVH